MALGVDLSASMQPQGYYGADGLWYAYPPGYDPNAAWQPQQQWDPNQQYAQRPYTQQPYGQQPYAQSQYAQQPYAQQGYERQAEPQGFYDQNTGVWYQWDPTHQAYYDPNTGTWYPQQQQWPEPAPQPWAAPQPPAPQWGQPPAPPPAPSWNPPAPSTPAWPAPAAPSAFAPSFAAEPAPAPKPSVPRAPVFIPPTFTIKPKPSVPAPPPVEQAPAPRPAPAPVAAEEPLEIEHDEVMEIGDEEVEELPVAEPPMVTTSLTGLTSNTSITKHDEAPAQMLAEEPGPQASAVPEFSTELAPAALADSSDEFFPSVDALTGHAPLAESFATPITSTFEPLTETAESVSIETTPLEEVALESQPDGAVPHASPTQSALDLADIGVDAPVHATTDLPATVDVPAQVEAASLDAVEEPLPSFALSVDRTPPEDPPLDVVEEPAEGFQQPAPLVEAPAAPWSSAPLALSSSVEEPDQQFGEAAGEPSPLSFEEQSVSVAPDLMSDGPELAQVEAPLSAQVVGAVTPSPVILEEPSISVSAGLMDDQPQPTATSFSTHVVAPTPMAIDEPGISVSADLMAEGEEGPIARTDITQELPPVVLPTELAEPSHTPVLPEVRLMPEPAPEPPALGDDEVPPTQPRLARVLPDGSTEVPLLPIRLAPPALSPPVSLMPATAPPAPPAPLPMPMALSQPELVPMPPASASASADFIVGEEPMFDATVEPMIEAEVSSEPLLDATVEPLLDATVEPLLDATVEPLLEATVEPLLEATVEPEAEVFLEPSTPAPAGPAAELVPVPAWSDVPSPVPSEPPLQAPPWDDVPEPPVSPPSGSSFDLLAMAPEAAPRIPIQTAAAAPLFAKSWENAEAEPDVKADPSLFASSFTAPPDEFADGADDKVELASNFDFVAPSPTAGPGDDVSIDTDEGEFVVESASAAELATNVRAGNAPPSAEEKLELANNFDFLDNSQLTGTGESWSDDRASIPLATDEDEVIQGIMLEEDLPAEQGDSWGTAVSPPSPVPMAPQPLAIRVPPLPAAPVVRPAPLAAAPPPPPPVAPAQAGGTVVPVPGEHRIILHTVEGQVKRGAIVNAKLGEPQLHLQLASGGNEVLPKERVKALFFMLAPGARPAATAGSKVRVTFKDGRQVAGFSADHQSASAGFFVVPADNRTNTERIFIFRHAVQSVAVDS